jgi:hypothetical protein
MVALGRHAVAIARILGIAQGCSVTYLLATALALVVVPAAYAGVLYIGSQGHALASHTRW